MICTNFTPFPILTTERLILRQLEITDAKDIFEHRNDDLVNIYLEDWRHATLEQSQAFIERVLHENEIGKSILWVLSQKGNNKFMGTVCLWNISKEQCKAETGYTIVSEFHKMGYMNEALEKIIDFGFNTMKLKTIDAYTHKDNTGSIQLLLKNHFKQGSPEEEVSNNTVFFLLKNEKA